MRLGLWMVLHGWMSAGLGTLHALVEQWAQVVLPGHGHGRKLEGLGILADGSHPKQQRHCRFVQGIPTWTLSEEPLPRKDSRRVQQRAFENSDYASF